MSRVNAVIFDLDGLLVDSEVYWERARRSYCASIDCDWHPDDERDVKGNNSREWAEAIRRRCRSELPPAAVIEGVVGVMRSLYDESVPLLAGAVDTVTLLAARVPLAVASSSPRDLIQDVLTRVGLRECFEVLVSADETARGKPHPDVFLEAAHRLRVPAMQIAVFEDSSAGIEAGVRAGMTVIAVPNAHFPPSERTMQSATIRLRSLVNFRLEMLGL